MTADRIASAFAQAASHLGFEFQAGFAVTLSDGSVVRSLGRLPLFGSKLGALVFADDAKPSAGSLRALAEMGYFTSSLFASYETFDAGHFAETLDDWATTALNRIGRLGTPDNLGAPGRRPQGADDGGSASQREVGGRPVCRHWRASASR